MVVFFNGLAGMPVLVQGIYQIVVEFLIKWFDSHCGLADGGNLLKIFPLQQQIHCFIHQLLIKGVIVRADRDDPGFIF